MYDLVSGKQLVKGSYLLSKSTALEEFPMLKADKLVGAIVYYDGQHNDARMNLAIALTAAREKANIANHVEAIGLIKEKVMFVVWVCVIVLERCLAGVVECCKNRLICNICPCKFV